MGIKNLPVKTGPCPSLHRPPSPPSLRKVYIFALLSMNGPLPAELKFRENTVLSCEVIAAIFVTGTFDF